MYHTNLLDEDLTLDAGPAVAAISQEGRTLRRYAEGDRGALDELILTYQESAYWQALRYVRDEQSALDVVQEAFIRVLDHAGDYDPHRPFKSWFLQIVRNLSVDWLRRRRREVSCAEVVREVDHDPAAGLDIGEYDQRVHSVLASLPDKYGRLLRWRELEEVRADAIAERIDVGYKTTRWRIHQARKLFRREWERRYGPYEQ